jgi:CBS domain-containing protein
MKLSRSLISDTVFYTDQQSEMQYFQTLSYNNTPKNNCYHYGKRVAQLMAEMRVNSAVVCEANVPIGIVTDTDMSSKIATGRFPITVAVNKIMSTPVVTVPENVSLAEAQLLMLKIM